MDDGIVDCLGKRNHQFVHFDLVQMGGVINLQEKRFHFPDVLGVAAKCQPEDDVFRAHRESITN